MAAHDLLFGVLEKRPLRMRKAVNCSMTYMRKWIFLAASRYFILAMKDCYKLTTIFKAYELCC